MFISFSIVTVNHKQKALIICMNYTSFPNYYQMFLFFPNQTSLLVNITCI